MPGADPETAVVVAAGAWWTLDEAEAMAQHDGERPDATALALELWVRDATGQVSRLGELGLSPPHPRYLGDLPTDAELFRTSERPEALPGAELAADIEHPRFALAAPGGLDPATVYVPLGVPGLLDDAFYQAAAPIPGSALERDGLAPLDAAGSAYFTHWLFVDPDLADSNVATLLTEAFHKEYQAPSADGTPPPVWF